MSDESELTAEVVVNSRRAWGRSELGATDALENMVVNFHDDFKPTEEIEVFHVKGFKGFRGLQPHAEEFTEDTERLKVDGSRLREIKEHLNQAELKAEETLAEAEEVE